MGKSTKKKDGTYFSKWYGENKDKVNSGRRDKYDGDLGYRDTTLARSRKNYRDKHGILSDGNTLVTSEGEEFVGIKITKAAELLGVDRQSLLRYINLGLLPKMGFDNTTLKFITVDQIPLVKKFFKLLKKKGTYKGSVQETATEMKEYLNTNWRNRDGSEKIINKEEGR